MGRTRAAIATVVVCSMSIDDLYMLRVKGKGDKLVSIGSMSHEEFKAWYLPLIIQVRVQERDEIARKQEAALAKGREYYSQNDKRGDVSLQLHRHCISLNKFDECDRFYLVSGLVERPALKKCNITIFVKEDEEKGKVQ